jgi:hypothetical protein
VSGYREPEYIRGWRQASVRGIIIYLVRMSAIREARAMKIGSIVIRCYEFDRMLAFWQEALHYVPREPVDDGWGGSL